MSRREVKRPPLRQRLPTRSGLRVATTMIMSICGTLDSAIISKWYGGNDHKLDRIQAADGVARLVVRHCQDSSKQRSTVAAGSYANWRGLPRKRRFGFIAGDAIYRLEAKAF
ncbi:hypothetical protein DLREEDagr8_21710 [Dongia sp. agr-C8]